LTKDYEEQAQKISKAFTGDSSFFAFNGEENEAEPDDPDLPPVERFREVHRLSYTIKVRPALCLASNFMRSKSELILLTVAI
jgi:hypothetical protein